MSRCLVILLSIALWPVTAQGYLGTPEYWFCMVELRDVQSAGGFEFGVRPGAIDGYNGEYQWSGQGLPGVAIQPYRQNGPDWSGPTGFYWEDYRSPIPPGESKTWDDIYLWAQNYTPPGGMAVVWIDPYTPPPSGYTGKLVLDYVPASLGWTGPMEFELDLVNGMTLVLPAPTVTDPLEGVRMHITVYAIPEPASLSVLVLAAAGFGAAVSAVRRKKRGPAGGS